MPEVKRRKGESFDSLLRRFSKNMQLSGRILQTKKIRYHTKPKSKNLQRKSALRRIKILDHREYLRKVGKLEDEFFDKNRNRKRK